LHCCTRDDTHGCLFISDIIAERYFKYSINVGIFYFVKVTLKKESRLFGTKIVAGMSITYFIEKFDNFKTKCYFPKQLNQAPTYFTYRIKTLHMSSAIKPKIRQSRTNSREEGEVSESKLHTP
jgi:hypothetical protein